MRYLLPMKPFYVLISISLKRQLNIARARENDGNRLKVHSMQYKYRPANWIWNIAVTNAFYLRFCAKIFNVAHIHQTKMWSCCTLNSFQRFSNECIAFTFPLFSHNSVNCVCICVHMAKLNACNENFIENEIVQNLFTRYK